MGELAIEIRPLFADQPVERLNVRAAGLVDLGEVVLGVLGVFGLIGSRSTHRHMLRWLVTILR